jgi:hypothetical protein
MGYLDNTTITIDAILTKKGRELLARGRSAFQITQFALADDEVDYDLWNPSHPEGDKFFGTVIENMPITEAIPDETQALKYKLITMDRGQTSIPYIKIANNVIGAAGDVKIANLQGESLTIEPKTYQVGKNGPIEVTYNPSYTFTLLDNSYVRFDPIAVGDEMLGRSVTTEGLRVVLRPQVRSISSDKTTKLIVTGTGTGARLVIPITINYVPPVTT